MRNLLVKYKGFDPNNIKVMVDNDKRYPQPTGRNIKAGLTELIRSGRPGDVLVFHSSGASPLPAAMLVPSPSNLGLALLQDTARKSLPKATTRNWTARTKPSARRCGPALAFPMASVAQAPPPTAERTTEPEPAGPEHYCGRRLAPNCV
jgi:hypothetical protein